MKLQRKCFEKAYSRMKFSKDTRKAEKIKA